MKKQIQAVMYCLVAVFGLIGCGPEPRVRYPEATRTAAPALPPYPNRTLVSDKRDREHYGMERRIIMFLTSDSPEDVRAYYREKLIEPDWTFVGEDETGLVLSNEVACPLYSIDILPTKIDTGTRVEVELSPVGCRP